MLQRSVHATLMACRAGKQHRAGSVEDHDRRDCTFCQIRHGDDAVFTKVTECYRSPKSAIRALQHWAADPDGTPQPALWQCHCTAMKSLLCDGKPDALALSLCSAVYVDELDNGPVAKICRDEDEAIFSCPACGQLLKFTLLDNSAHQGASERYSLPTSASRACIVEHSSSGELGLAPTPTADRGGLSTHVRYVTDCDHEDNRGCEQDESLTWCLDQPVAVNQQPLIHAAGTRATTARPTAAAMPHGGFDFTPKSI